MNTETSNSDIKADKHRSECCCSECSFPPGLGHLGAGWSYLREANKNNQQHEEDK